MVNKLGAYFKLQVPHSLLVQDITFDAVDSSSEWSENCLGEARYTCEFNKEEQSISSLVFEADGSGCCSQPRNNLNFCNFNSPTSFFEMGYTSSN